MRAGQNLGLDGLTLDSGNGVRVTAQSHDVRLGPHIPHAAHGIATHRAQDVNGRVEVQL